ncbi:MAG: hypothetical protein KAY32_16795 [Candidatus Eisenbacteria sp.]|nr:hypothetical protein [Candidatus Eisenbacteria bacterium]
MDGDLPLTKKSLRARLAGDLRLEELPEKTWSWLVEEDYVDDYLHHKLDREQYAILLKRAAKPIGERPGRKLGQKTGAKTEPALKELEWLRSVVYSRYLARLASHRPEVRELRSRLFRGTTLRGPEAIRFFSQIGPRYVTHAWFVESGISPVHHSSHYTNYKGDPTSFRQAAGIRLAWKGKTRDIKITDRLSVATVQRWTTLHLRRKNLPVKRESLFGEIQEVASFLARSYHWDGGDATAFLVEGRIPYVLPIRVSPGLETPPDHLRMVATLEFEPWVTDDTVLRAYREARRKMMSKQSRLIPESRLRLFDFVAEYCEKTYGKSWEDLVKEEVDFPWREVAQLWKRDHPKSKFRCTSEVKNAFKTTHAEMIRPVLGPLYPVRKRSKSDT